LLPEAVLELQILNDRFDHDVAVREIGDVRGEVKPRHGRIAIGLAHLPLALLDGAIEALFDARPAPLAQRVAYLAHSGHEAGLRAHLRDSRSHESGAEHACGLDGCHAVTG